MPGFCHNCGAPVDDGERFCAKCGTPVQPAKQNATNQSEVIENLKKYSVGSAKRAPQQPVQQAQYAPQQYAAPSAPQYQPGQQYAKTQYQIAPAKKKKGRGGLIAAIALILAAAIVVGVFGFREGGWFRSGNTVSPDDLGEVKKSDEGKVSAESPAVTLCGVTVDVIDSMLASGERNVKVSVYDGGRDSDGSEYDAYELEMDGGDRFEIPVEVTFPCKADDGYDAVIEHFEDGEWKPLITETDRDAGTVSAVFGSFSPARVSYRKVGDNPSLYGTVTDEDNPYMIKVGLKSNYWEILKRTNPSEYSDEIESFIDDPQNYAVAFPELDPKMDAKAAYKAFTDTNTMWPFYDAMINLGIETLPPASQSKVVGFMIDHSTELGNAMNAIPFVAMAAQVGFDLYTGADPVRDAGVNLYKNLIGSSGAIYSLVTGYSHIGFTLAFVGVALFGMELDYFIDAAKEAKAENVRDVFNAYYEQIEPFDALHWYEVFENAYWKADGKADKAMNAVKEAVDEYCGKFWSEIYDEGNEDILFAATSAGYKKVFFDATPEQKAALTEQQKAKVWNLIETKSMKMISRFLKERMQENTRKQLAAATDPYNKEMYFKIMESVDQETTEVTKYQGCTVCLGTGGVPITGVHWNVPKGEDYDDGWEIGYECTILGFLKMGMADQVLVYKDEKAYSAKEKPLLVKDFSPVMTGDRITVVELGNDKTPATGAPEWLEGAWSYASYNGDGGTFSGFHRESVRITVIDDDTLLYEEYYYPDPDHPDNKFGVDYGFEREYYYDEINDCVFILQTDTGYYEGAIFPGVSDKDYLSPLKIDRMPGKDHLTGCPAARFIHYPREITGDEKTEKAGNLRFNRDKAAHDWTFNGTALPEPETKGTITEWTVKDDSVTIRIDGMSYDEYKAYCRSLQSMSGWSVTDDEDASSFPADYNSKSKVYFTGEYKNLPRIAVQYYNDETCAKSNQPHFCMFVFTKW